MKYLVILYGLPNGGKLSWNSLKNNLIKPLNADIAVVIPDTLSLPNRVKNEAALKFVWRLEEKGSLKDYYKKLGFENSYKQFVENKSYGLYPSGAIAFASKFKVLENKIEIQQKYDFVIFTRFDNYQVYEKINFDKDRIHIVDGQDYGGINDRFLATSSHLIDEVFDILSFTEKNDVSKLNCEKVWFEYLNKKGLLPLITRFERNSFLISKKDDPTNWRKGIYKIYFYKNTYIKYPQEFIDAMKNSFKNNRFKHPRFQLNYLYLLTKIQLGKIKRTYE